MIMWTKPSGTKIETLDDRETIKYCLSLNWVREGVKPVYAEAKIDLTPKPRKAGKVKPKKG